MSAVKHQPASALPWIVGMSGEEIAHTDEGEECDLFDSAALPHVPQRHVSADVSYAVHAANAYPKLVEALRNLHAGWRDVPDDMQVPECLNDGRFDEAAALLRDLGEEA